jgi:hypothetical protein
LCTRLKWQLLCCQGTLATLSASALIVIGADLVFRQDETQAQPICLVRSTEAALQRWLRSQLVEGEVVVVEEEGEEEETGVDEVVVVVVECRAVAVVVLVMVVGVGVEVEGVGEGENEEGGKVKLEEVKAGVTIAVVATVVRVVVTKTSIASTSVSNQVLHLLSLHHTQHRLLI